jgi:hypothetical protein
VEESQSSIFNFPIILFKFRREPFVESLGDFFTLEADPWRFFPVRADVGVFSNEVRLELDPPRFG